MADDANRKEIFAEYGRICELLEEAYKSGDDAEMIKCSRLYAEFTSVHYASINLTEDDVAEFKKSGAEYEESVVEEQICAKKTEEAARKLEKARGKYYDALLEQTPAGKKRTAH